MLDWALAVPLMGTVATVLRTRANRSLLGAAVVVTQAAAVLVLLFVDSRPIRYAAAGAGVIAWVWTLVHVNQGGPADPPMLKILEACSPVSYALAYPLFFTGKNNLERAVGAAILVVHAITIPTIVILVWASELHDAWGCYGSQVSIYDFDRGLCGQWNVDQIQICRDIQATDPGNVDCTSDTKPWEFFGKMIHRIISYEMVAINFWVVMMVEQFATAA